MSIQALKNRTFRFTGIINERQQDHCQPLRVLMMAIACLFLTNAFAESVKKDTIQKAKAKQEVVKKEVIKKESKASAQKVATKDGIEQELYKDEQGSFYKCYLSAGNGYFDKSHLKRQPIHARRIYKKDYPQFMRRACSLRSTVINSLTEKERKSVLVKGNLLNLTFFVDARGRMIYSYISMKQPVTNQLSAETIKNIFKRVKRTRFAQPSIRRSSLYCQQTITINS